MSLEKYAIDLVKVEIGIVEIKKRSQRLELLLICSSTIFLVSMIALYLQQDFVYGFFGLTTEIKQLHIPVSADGNLNALQKPPDYFANLLSWFGWLIVKLFASFIGAFIIFKFLKKFNFFAKRFKSFILRFVGWLIAFICIWSGLTYVQYDLRDKHNNEFNQAIYYDKDIQQSELAQYLKDSNLDKTIQAYLLAQTALLHRPVDKDAAIPYVLELAKAEKQNANFIQYGFKPEQLWIMQHQVYGQTLSPLAESVEIQVKQAEQVNVLVRYFLNFLIIFIASIALMLFLLVRNFKNRILRIQQQIYTSKSL